MDLRLVLASKPLLLIHPPKPHFTSRSFHSSSFSSSCFRVKTNSSLQSKHKRAVSCSFQSNEDDNAAAAIEKIDSEMSSSSLDSQTIIWKQIVEIAAFAGPATGLWICGPLMSLIDTMVIGQSSSIELAALGPGTVFCDYLSYIFMFLSIATSNMVATSLAKKDKDLAQHQISMLLFVAFASGVGMFLFTRLIGAQVLARFAGVDNLHLLPAANTYVQIRNFAWPAILVGMVAQSASLGMKDSWGPLKALAVASAINGVGDVLLCCVWKYGIAGAAWATMLSQVVAAGMMMRSLNNTGFKAFQLSIPSPGELFEIFEIAAPVFITMTSKVAFYTLLTYFATSMGTITVAAHQVMINVYCMCTVWGEPLSQTAQSFMPELIHGVNRSLLKMHKVILPYFIALMITPSTHSLEGTLMASRDLKFFSVAMTGCLFFSGLLLLLLSSRGSLSICWWALAVFQWARFSIALQRLVSPRGILNRKDRDQTELVRAA